jgi:hypothetical protein
VRISFPRNPAPSVGSAAASTKEVRATAEDDAAVDAGSAMGAESIRVQVTIRARRNVQVALDRRAPEPEPLGDRRD